MTGAKPTRRVAFWFWCGGAVLAFSAGLLVVKKVADWHYQTTHCAVCGKPPVFQVAEAGGFLPKTRSYCEEHAAAYMGVETGAP